MGLVTNGMGRIELLNESGKSNKLSGQMASRAAERRWIYWEGF
ncbi:MAG: hypothetical protein CM1200mP4_0010 [Rhodospirillaceae bacterium]|nr:MAG: hypothetical protein CM1200mP4_0010 [Rhodospirillaceae bacterium]